VPSRRKFNNPKLVDNAKAPVFSISSKEIIAHLKEIMLDDSNFEKVRLAAARALYKTEPQATVDLLEKIMRESPNAGAKVMAAVILLKLRGNTEEGESTTPR